MVSAIIFPLPAVSPLRAKIQTLRFAIIFYSFTYLGLLIETDCMTIFPMIRNARTFSGDLRADIDRLNSFLHLTQSGLHYTPQETNSVAHHLASEALHRGTFTDTQILQICRQWPRGLLTDLTTVHLRS